MESPLQHALPGSPEPNSNQGYTVAALYQFTAFEDPAQLRPPLLDLMGAHDIRGTLLLAREGINGTVAGTQAAIDTLLVHIRSLPGCSQVDVKFSHTSTMPFHRTKVRVKKEIVTMGQPDIDPRGSAGTYVSAQDWNALIRDPDTIVIDTRNDYEVAAGTFTGAIDPKTSSFRQFPDWFRRERERLLTPADPDRPVKVAMFCTGGIRCEKSTAFLKSEGVDEVYHLKGGILKYLETVPETQSLWEGECFVFDGRVSVGHGLTEGAHSLCYACRRPVDEAGRASPLYEEGASCAACFHERTDAQRAGYRERARQEALALRRGEPHVGAKQADRSPDRPRAQRADADTRANAPSADDQASG